MRGPERVAGIRQKPQPPVSADSPDACNLPIRKKPYHHGRAVPPPGVLPMPAILKFNARAGLAGFVKVAPDGRVRGWIVDVDRPGSRLDLRLTRGGHVIEHARTPTTGLLASTSLGLASHSFTFDRPPVPVEGSADIFLDLLGADLSTIASVELQFTLPVKPSAPLLPPSPPDDAGDRAVLPVPPKPATAKVPKIGPRPGEYQRWITEFDSLDDADRAYVAADIASWIEPPLISLVLLSGNPEAQDQTIRSLSEQLCPHWELIVRVKLFGKGLVGRLWPDLTPADGSSRCATAPPAPCPVPSQAARCGSTGCFDPSGRGRAGQAGSRIGRPETRRRACSIRTSPGCLAAAVPGTARVAPRSDP